MRHIFRYLRSYLLTFFFFAMTVIPHHATSPVVCDADYILMLNSVMEYNRDSLQLTIARSWGLI